MKQLWKKRPKKVGSISYYIEEVVKYGTKRKIDQTAYDGYPPVVPELLLSLLIEIRSLCIFGRFVLGMFFLIALKLLFKVG